MKAVILNFTGQRENWGCQATSWNLYRFCWTALKPLGLNHLAIVPLPSGCISDRFLQWRHGARIRAIPKADVVKFPTEFIWQAPWFARLRGRMPWLKKRWSGLTAVTFPGLDMKGQDLAMLPENAEITDRKGRHIICSHSVLGPVQQPIKDYYLALKQSEEQEGTS